MIKKEFLRTRTDGIKLYRTYSDSGYVIRKYGTAEIYNEAIDVETAECTYVETSALIERSEDTDAAVSEYCEPEKRI